MSVALTATFDPTKTVNSRRQRVDFTPTGGTVVKISCKALDVESKLTTSILKQPGTDDLIRDVAEVAIEAEETLTIVDIEEIDAVLDALTGLNGLVQGTAKAYVKDPRDASAAVVRYSITGAAGAAFACSLRRPDGAVKFGGTDFSKTSLILRNLSGAKLMFNKAAAAPDTIA